MSGIQHYDTQIHALDERIGRLAILCGADLSRPEIIVGIIKGHFEGCSHQAAVDPKQREELRALLIMKYRIEVSCIDSIGAKECAQLIFDQDEELRRKGFPPGSLAR